MDSNARKGNCPSGLVVGCLAFRSETHGLIDDQTDMQIHLYVAHAATWAPSLKEARPPTALDHLQQQGHSWTYIFWYFVRRLCGLHSCHFCAPRTGAFIGGDYSSSYQRLALLYWDTRRFSRADTALTANYSIVEGGCTRI